MDKLSFLDEDQQKFLELVIKREKETLMEGSNVMPKVFIDGVNPETKEPGMSIFGIDPRLMATGRLKDFLAEQIREWVKQCRATCVIMSSDSWSGHQTKEQYERCKHLEKLEGRSFGIPERNQRGLLTDFCELLMLTVCTPLASAMVICKYDRDSNNKPVFRDTQVFGENDEGHMMGRFANFFEPIKNDPPFTEEDVEKRV